MIVRTGCMTPCLLSSDHTLFLCSPQPVHYRPLCVFFSFDQMLLSKDRTGDPRAPWVEISFRVAWFYLARCCLCPLAKQPIMSNSNILPRALHLFSSKSFCDGLDRCHGEACALFLPSITSIYIFFFFFEVPFAEDWRGLRADNGWVLGLVISWSCLKKKKRLHQRTRDNFSSSWCVNLEIWRACKSEAGTCVSSELMSSRGESCF